MKSERTLSATQVPNQTQTMDQLNRRTMNTPHKEPVMNEFRLLINGRLVEGAGALDVINPATGRVLTTAPRADRAQLEEAVAAAKAAFPA
jgi:Aldehyde dehydrogenase family